MDPVTQYQDTLTIPVARQADAFHRIQQAERQGPLWGRAAAAVLAAPTLATALAALGWDARTAPDGTITAVRYRGRTLNGAQRGTFPLLWGLRASYATKGGRLAFQDGATGLCYRWVLDGTQAIFRLDRASLRDPGRRVRPLPPLPPRLPIAGRPRG